MSDWEILGIAPTEDLREIKRAYSRALRIHHPEKDPEGFQRLREAYKRLQARTDLPSGSAIPFVSPSEASTPRPANPDLEQRTPTENSGIESTDSLENLFAESLKESDNFPWVKFQETDDIFPNESPTDPLDDLIGAWDGFWGCIDNRHAIDGWRIILARPELWDLKVKLKFNRLVLNCLQSAYQNKQLQGIPLQTWHLLDHAFDWHAHELELSKTVDDDFLDHLMFKIREAAEVFEPDNYPKSIVVSKSSKKTGATAGSVGFSVLMILLFNIFKDCNDSNKRPIDLVPQYTTFKYRKIDDTNRNTQPSVEEVLGSRQDVMQYIRHDQGPYSDSGDNQNIDTQGFDSVQRIQRN